MEPAKKSVPTILPQAFGRAEHKRGDYVADIAVGVEMEEILEPGYWAHIAAELAPLDTIEARWEDGSKIAHLRVIFAERTYAKVKLIGEEDLSEIANEIPVESLKHTVEWKGPTRRFAVVRNSDHQIVQDGFKERTQASAWMVEHERT